MSKTVMNSPGKSDIVSKADNIDSTELKLSGNTSVAQNVGTADFLFYQPSNNDQKLKAKFWNRFSPGPGVNLNSITLAGVKRVVNSSSLEQLWLKPGFKDWFLNKDETRERLVYLFNKSLDTLESILDNELANANARMNAVKLLAEMTGHLVKKGGPEKFADQEIENMTENQLKEYLTRKGVKLVEEKIIDTSSKSSDVTSES